MMPSGSTSGEHGCNTAACGTVKREICVALMRHYFFFDSLAGRHDVSVLDTA